MVVVAVISISSTVSGFGLCWLWLLIVLLRVCLSLVCYRFLVFVWVLVV